MADIERHIFADDGTFPNSRLPALIYRGATAGDGPDTLERLFKSNGWPPQWRATVFTFHHYHSRSHECLGVATGNATLRLGGPQGQEVRVNAGDVVVIPAGVAHQRVVASPDFWWLAPIRPGRKTLIPCVAIPVMGPRRMKTSPQLPCPNPTRSRDRPGPCWSSGARPQWACARAACPAPSAHAHG